MDSAPASATPEEIGFLLLPEFAMVAFFAAVEPLRIANRCAGRTLYTWRIYSADGEPVVASNGMTLLADAAIGDDVASPTVLVCSSFNHEAYTTPAVLRWLRRLEGRRTVLGGIDTGCFLLAQAGLLEGHRVTLHWESIPAFRERYPHIECTAELYEIDRRRLTSAGGTSTMDLMLRLIGQRHGPELATAVSEQLIHQRIRNPTDHQRMRPAARLGVHNPTLLAAVDYMGRHIEQPASVIEVARRCGVSQRQLERLFHDHLGTTPRRYYLGLRLEHAHDLLQQTELPVLDVALACGFGSTASLSRTYRGTVRAPAEPRPWLAGQDDRVRPARRRQSPRRRA
ncbi:MAG: GlxA family transcriptional regulator [Halofilum sp. (in: g-proteobacteria)]|nr:GlxA family transcriptional regulator [Halofilum sp. (in: g-proteobacteria)]